MERAQFHRLCAGLNRLSPRHVSDLEARLFGLGDRMETMGQPRPDNPVPGWPATQFSAAGANAGGSPTGRRAGFARQADHGRAALRAG
jgi:hypothetical protein